tara:strand:+ start:4542 stop:5711 length:1170 start_codon:yes stop_codon:yes gene_type:complete
MILVILILIFIIVFNSIQPTYEPLEDYMGPLNAETLKTCLKHPEYEEGDVSCGFINEYFDDPSYNLNVFHKLSNQKFYSDREIVNDLKYFNNASSLINYNRDNSGNSATNGGPRFTDFLPEIVPEEMYGRLTTDISFENIDNSVNQISNQILYIEQEIPKIKEQLITFRNIYEFLDKTLMDNETSYEKLRFKRDIVFYFNRIRYFNRYFDRLYFHEDTNNMIVLLGNMITYQSYIQDIENNTYDETKNITVEEINKVLYENSQINPAGRVHYQIRYSSDDNIPEKIINLKHISRVIKMYLSSIEEAYNEFIQQKIESLQMDKNILLGIKESQILPSLTGKYSQNYFLSNLRNPDDSNYDNSGAKTDFEWFNNASAIYSGYIKEGKLSAM